MRPVVIIAALAIAGCDGTPNATPDASVDIDAPAPSGPCWPDGVRTPRGSVTLGTGRDGFQAMPDMLPLEYGSQDGFMLIANVRMTGFAPGNPQNVLDPRNPRTRIRAFFDETNIPLNYYAKCPFRSAYVPSPAGDLVLVEAAPVIFETCWRADNVVGKRVRIELEVMDAAGDFYTTDVKIVTAAPPLGAYPVETNSPGCVH